MTTTQSTAPATGLRHRNDIDGLRTVAIVLVVIYHVWLGRVSGGVDVFLMISAFLLTASLTRRAAEGTPLALGAFWSRRFRRLVPAAAVTMLGILAAALAFMPPTQWPRIWSETLASLFYVENWHLALAEVDYYARDSAETSPLQHFWSLSVQGQVFLLWPVLIALVAVALRTRRHLVRPVLGAVFAGIFISSLWFSITETRDAQAFAYFDTRTRLWEFAAGSLVALALPHLRPTRLVGAILGWAGLVGIVLCGIVLDVRGGFPGHLALWPVLCTAAVIVSGNTPSRLGPARLLSSRPLTVLTPDAYALYLVHWPILVFWMAAADTDRVGPLSGLAVVALSLVAARLLSRGVEQPLMRGSARPGRGAALRGIALVAASVVVVAGATGGWRWIEQTRTQQLANAAADADYPGAAQVEVPFEIASADVPLLPAPTALDGEWEAVGPACAGALAPSASILDGTCNQSPDADIAAMRILVIGDSHAQQLAAPLIALSEDRDLAVITLLQGGCTVGVLEESRSGSMDSCEPWVRAALQYAAEIRPDAVYTVLTRADAEQPERLLHGVDQAIDAFAEADIPVIGIRDNPRFSFDMYACALDESRSCDVARDDVLAPENPAAALSDAVTVVDFTPWLCPWDVCHAAIGNIAVYIDDNHLSRSYARTLAPFLDEILTESHRVALPSA
ncbi:acyltransferase family protein [Microbacterium sp. CR_7]|uniref:acyltransferase family protein n=1 Tax=Microbacterium sp. CR_7 TaxID=3055792 RepID=UPI0035BF7A6D